MSQAPSLDQAGLAALQALCDAGGQERRAPASPAADPASPLEAALGGWFSAAVGARRGELERARLQLTATLALGERTARRSPGPGSGPHQTLHAGLKRLLGVAGVSVRRHPGTVQSALRGLAPVLVPLLAQTGPLAHVLGLAVPPGGAAPAALTEALPPGSLAVDLGTGDGTTLAGLASRHSDTRWVGIDLVGAPPEHPLPDNALRLLVAAGSPEDIAAAVLETVPAGTAALVTLCYPAHRKVRGADGPVLAHLPQLDTALQLLAPGGRGVLITEDPIALRTALAHLRAHPLARSVAPWAGPLPAAALSAAGVTPYTPTLAELGPVPASLADRNLGPFRWGLGLDFGRV